MTISVNTNLFSLNAQRSLNSSQSSLSTSMQRLSSGLRVNSAKDDAAGLAIPGYDTLSASQVVPRLEGLVGEDVWTRRFDEINTFEEDVAGSGTTIIKVMLHISPEEQKATAYVAALAASYGLTPAGGAGGSFFHPVPGSWRTVSGGTVDIDGTSVALWTDVVPFLPRTASPSPDGSADITLAPRRKPKPCFWKTRCACLATSSSMPGRI